MDWKKASTEDKAQLLGDEFRNIAVLDVQEMGEFQKTHILLEGKTLCLVGDPSLALKTILGGNSDGMTRN